MKLKPIFVPPIFLTRFNTPTAMRHLVSFLLLLLFFQPLAEAQQYDNSGPILQIGLHYGYQWPGGNLRERFGNNGITGLQMDFTLPNGWTAGLQASLLFGKTVKTDVLAPLRDENGLIYNYDGAPANILLRERGQYYGLHLGYFFRGKKPAGDQRGLSLQCGAGLLQHKLRITGDVGGVLPQLSGNYLKGYDRLTNGLALRQSLGYRYLNASRRINVAVELEAYQAFTQSRRDWNIDQMAADTQKRLDLLFGFKVSWILPLYIRENGDEIEY